MQPHIPSITVTKRPQPFLAGTTSPADRLLRVSEVQRELGISRATAYRMMSDGTLPVYRFRRPSGGRPMVRVSLRDLRQWRESQKEATCPFPVNELA